MYGKTIMSDETGTSSKKRRRNSENYERNKKKNARLMGSQYISHSGKNVDCKTLGQPCK